MKEIVLVDLDGVLADFHGELFRIIHEDHPEIILPTNHSKYFISDHFDDQKIKDKIWNIKKSPGFFASLPVMKNGIEGLKRIVAAGYHPQICSSPLKSNPTCKEEKLLWIKKYLAPEIGEFLWEEAIITHDKADYPGIALIDDRPDIKNSDQATWKQVVFHHSYNIKAESPYRIFGWLDPNLEDILKKCEGEARK